MIRRPTPVTARGVFRLRTAHAAYADGNRQPWAVEGERIYNAWRHRLHRHQRLAELRGQAECRCRMCIVPPMPKRISLTRGRPTQAPAARSVGEAGRAAGNRRRAA